MFDPGPCVYMDKLVVGPDLVDAVDFAAPIEATLATIARTRGISVADVTVALLDRPRHAGPGEPDPRGRRPDQVPDRRRRGRRADGACNRSPRSTCWSGSAAPRRASSPRARSGAWAARSTAGCTPATTRRASEARSLGHSLERVLTTTDLVRGNNAYFVATGVTDGEVLRGVRYAQDLADHPIAVHAIEQRRGPHHRDQASTEYVDPGPVDPESIAARGALPR